MDSILTLSKYAYTYDIIFTLYVHASILKKYIRSVKAYYM